MPPTDLDLINKPNKSYNTGVKGTDIPFEAIIGYFLAPAGWTIDLSQDLKPQLLAAAYNVNKNQRIYGLPPIAECQDNSTDPKNIQWGYGAEHTVGDGVMQAMFFPHNPGKAVLKMMRKFNGEHSKWQPWLIDQRFRIYCTKDKDVVNPRGFSLMNLWADNWKFNDGNGVKLGQRMAFLNAVELCENLHVIDAGFDVLSYMGTVNDVEISVAAPLSSGTIKLFLTTNDGHDNFVDLYGDAIDVTSAFTPKVHSNGTAITISAISQTIVNGKKAISMTMTTNLPASGQKLIIPLADLTVMDGLDVPGYESNVLEVTVP